MSARDLIVGAILAGGEGRRIGGRKSAVDLAGQTLSARVAATLAPHVAALAVVGDDEAAAALRATALNDPPGAPKGPLAGIGAALDWAAARKADWLVTSPCDTPLLPGDLIARLHAAAEGQADLAFARTADGDHPLAAIWSVALAPRIGALLHDGVHPPLHTLVEDLRGVHVWFADAAAFLNINTPEDLARARALLAR